MEKIQVQHPADLYAQLGEVQNHQGISFLATKEFFETVDKKHLTRDVIAKKSKIYHNTVYQALKKKAVDKESVEKIALAAGISFNRVFTNSRVGRVLSNQDHPASPYADFCCAEQSGGVGSDQGEQSEAKYTGTAMGIMMTAGAGGGIAVPLLIGTLTNFGKIYIVFWVVPILIVFILVTQIFIEKLKPHQEHSLLASNP